MYFEFINELLLVAIFDQVVLQTGRYVSVG